MSKRRKIKSGSTYKNKSRIFLLPMLDLDVMHSNDKHDFLIDVNIIQEGFPQVVLIFENVDYEPLKEDIYRLSNSPYYVDSEFADEDKEVCMFFDIPKEYRKDFEKFTQGKYSQFSVRFKDRLIKEYGTARSQGINETNNLPAVSLYDVICPTLETRQLMKDQLGVSVHVSQIKEVLDPPNLDLEEYKSIEEYGN